MSFWRGEDRIAREADAWIARLHGPDGTAVTTEFEAWRAADPRHAAAFRRSERLWLATGNATRTSPVLQSAPLQSSRAAINRGPRFALAAIVATIFVAGGTYLFERPGFGRLGPRAQLSSQATPQTIHLADGSIVLLGADSIIATNFDGGIRAVTLTKGRARFSVAHDTAHPFVVSAAGRTVTARGTIFDVALRPAGLSVMMIEGIVDVAHAGPGGSQTAPVRLHRGDRLVADGAAETVTSGPQKTALQMGRDYPPTPVSTILAAADVTAKKPIILEDARIGEERIEGRFDLSDKGLRGRCYRRRDGRALCGSGAGGRPKAG